MNKLRNSHRSYVMSVVGFCIVAIPALIYFTVSATDHSDSKQAPKTLIGKWHQVNTKDTGVTMEATISPGAIQINMIADESSSIYWMGTFDSDENPSKPFKTVSHGDQDAMAMSILASSSAEKSFAYKDGDLSYKFSIMGTTTTVHLAK